MPGARRTISAPFVLEPSKLNRILEVINSKFKEAGLTPYLRFQVDLKGQKLIETTAVEQVLAIDNTEKARIRELSITCTDSEKTEKPPDTFVNADFDGTHPAGIFITVRGKNATWVNETFSAIEEQAERTTQNSLLHRLTYKQTASWVIAVVIAIATIVSLGFATSTLEPTKLTNRMWLTTQDLEKLEQKTSSGNLTPEQAAEILSYQVRNVIQNQKQRSSLLGWAKQWRTLLAVVPFLTIIGAIVHLYYKCYPHAVFLWGDAEDWYRGVLRRRSLIWNGIIVAFGISILANFFVLALHS